MIKSSYQPPYNITDKIVTLVSKITEITTKITVYNSLASNPRLRRDNRVKTIHATLAIENNTLSLDQVTDIVNGKRVLGAPVEIREVKNAYQAYEKLLFLNPYSIDDMLSAHRILMRELTQEVGMFRKGNVGIFAGEKLVHMAPPAKHVPDLIDKLFTWLKNAKEVHPLVKSSVFHYELEFFHPFIDGNGRIGRMWQTLLLYQWNNLFGWLPIETLIRERQDEYYWMLGECDKNANSEKFIEFLLQTIYDSLQEIALNDQVNVQVTDQVKMLLKVLGNKELSARELMNGVKLKHMPNFRKNYLLPALQLGLIEMTVPDKPRSKNQRYRRI